MRKIKWMAKHVARGAVFVKRGLLAAAVLAAPPLLIALAPAHAFAQERLQIAPLQGTDAPAWLLSDYLPFSSPGGATLQGLLTHTAARDLLMAVMFAICIAMVFGASYLWRENVNRFKADAERKQRNDLGGL